MSTAQERSRYKVRADRVAMFQDQRAIPAEEVVEKGADRKFVRDAKGNKIQVSPKMDVENMRETHARVLRILKHVDVICVDNDLVYWVCGGTLIGAIRHEGFIPFDGDIDIAMPFDSYEKFRKLAPKLLPHDIWLQDTRSDPHFPVHKKYEAKLRDLNSDYRDYSMLNKDVHNGIQLDIFIPLNECYRMTKSTCCKTLNDPMVAPLRRQAFENLNVNVPAQSEKILSMFYGDWSALPKVKDRLSKQGHVDFVAPDWVKEKYPELYKRLEK